MTADPTVGNAAIRVYAALRSFADRDGSNCYPRESEVAKAAAMSRQAVCAHLQALERKGYIEIRRRRADNGARLSNIYEFIDPDTTSENLTGAVRFGPDPTSENLTGAVRFRASPIDDQSSYQSTDQNLPHPARAREGGLDDFSPDFMASVRFIEDQIPDLAPWTAERHHQLVTKFQLHYRAKGQIPVDLDAAFREWLLNEPQFEAKRHQRQGSMLLPVSGGRSPRPRRESFTDAALDAIKRGWAK